MFFFGEFCKEVCLIFSKFFIPNFLKSFSKFFFNRICFSFFIFQTMFFLKAIFEGKKCFFRWVCLAYVFCSKGGLVLCC